MKIGIYMAYGPATVLGKEGLGRYIGNLIKGFENAGHQVTIACPQWSLDTIDDLFQDFRIKAENIDFIVSYRSPALWRIYEKKYKKKNPKSNLKYKLLKRSSDVLGYFVNQAISITSMAGLVCAAACLGILGLMIGVLMLPVVLLCLLSMLAIKLIKKLAHKGEFLVKQTIRKYVSAVQSFTGKKLVDWRISLSGRRDEVVGKDLVSKVNAAKEKQDVWFVPALFWPEIKDLKGQKVVCAPDIVTIEFPMLFSEQLMVPSTERCSQVVEKEEYFITYCEYLKEHMLVQQYGKKKENIVAIPHVNNDMHEYITVDIDNKKLNSGKDFSTAFARIELIEAKAHYCGSPKLYMDSFQMADTRYIFYASQVRPHKNLINLIKSFEYLLRKRFLKVKLILTGDYEHCPDPHTYNYIKDHRLEYDILSFCNVSAQELAALYKCAELVVNPTLYEGGFPFTFGEGMSVGTPSVMSDIPQTREVVEPYGLADDMLFDPYDYRAMADRIEYGLNHREELYQRELPLYRELEKRTADVVANEYIAAFQYFQAMKKERQDA